MSENDPAISYARNLASLDKVLSGVKRPGDFYVSGNMEAPMPLLKVTGAGTISFPVPPEQCRRLIASAAKRAPYGRGDKTLHDESVRKVWQVSAGKVHLGGKGWAATFKTLLARVAAGLGCPAERITAELYKMLIYDRGAFFKPHRDTEKAAGMFGTLILSLPSAHAGGNLVIRHAGREITENLSSDDPAVLRFAAFYADCEHEVLPVTRGFRVCLVFNLVHKAGKTKLPATAPDHRRATEEGVVQLRSWVKSGGPPQKLVYLLEHHYTQAGLSLAGLKNRDAVIARVLREAAERAGCAFHLGILHIEDSGWAEYFGGYYGRRRRYWDGEEEDDDFEDSDFEIGEVCDNWEFIDQWRDVADRSIALGKIPLNEGEVLPIGALDGAMPDRLHFSEATGNEGASFERTYLHAAIVIWPERRTDLICASGGIDAAITRLGQRVKQSGKDADAAKAVRELAGVIPELWDIDGEEGARLDRLLSHLIRFGDKDLLLAAMEALLTENYDAKQNKTLVRACGFLGPESAASRYIELFDKRCPDNPASCIDLWILMAASFAKYSDHTPLLANLLERLVERLPQTEKRSSRYDYSSRFLDTADQNKGLTPDLLIKLLVTVADSPIHGRTRDVAAALTRNTERFPTDPLLVAILETAENTGPSLPGEGADIVWQHCANDLLARAEFPPLIPQDWAQKVTFSNPSQHFKELQAFARDPEARVHRFRVRKELRREIHQAIESRNLDMTHVTERSGSPYTLVCTKNRRSFARACRKHRSDKAAITRLLSLRAASHQPGDLVERLRAAAKRPTPNPANVEGARGG